MTIEELAAEIKEKFAGVDQQFARIDQRFAGIDSRFDTLEKKVDEGFNDSKVRDEALQGLMTFGFEARDVLRDEMHRRFDDAARQNEEQLTLLKDAVRQQNQRK